VKVNTSHPKIPGTEAMKEIEIKDGIVTRVDLELAYKAPNAVAPDDAGPQPRLH
jgi:hypothetical protein